MPWKQNKREILKQVCSSYLQLWFVISWRSLPVNFFFKMSAAFERKSTVLYGDATPSPSLTLFHCLSSQLLVCWINTLLSPSYVTEASKLLRRSPRPDADQQEARIIRTNIQNIKRAYFKRKNTTKETFQISMSTTCLPTFLYGISASPRNQRFSCWHHCVNLRNTCWLK